VVRLASILFLLASSSRSDFFSPLSSYCGNVLSNGASLSIPSTASPMPCAADSSLTCGAGNALQIVYDPSKVSSSLVLIGGAASSAVSGAQASATAVAGNVGSLAAGFKSASSSLIAEGSSGRALTGASTSSQSMTPAVCASYCSNLGYGISGTEYSTECELQPPLFSLSLPLLLLSFPRVFTRTSR
jgi:hypothetical protein